MAYTYKIDPETVGRGSILFSLMGGEKEEIITEDVVANSSEKPADYLEKTALRSFGDINIQESKIENELTFMTPGGGALVRPDIKSIDSPGVRSKIERYIVQEGDTVSVIAEKFGLSTDTVLWANNLGPRDFIKPGDKLTILPITGVIHKIKGGETVSSLSKKYKAQAEQIVEYNKLASADDIEIGQTLIIPDGEEPAVIPPASSRGSAPSTIRKFFTPATNRSFGMFWPVNSRTITQYFQWRHQGIDIADNSGVSVYASDDGRVESAAWFGGYGYQVVIDHGNSLKTRYAHLSKFYIRVGDSVKKGQAIAAMGSTGWSTGPHVHFEIMSQGVRVNPFNYVR